MLASVIVLGVSIVAQAQPSLGDIARARAKKPEIALRYDWPDGMTARIETERSRERRSGDTTTSSSVKLSVTMRSAKHPEGRLIRFDDLRVVGLPAGAAFPGGNAVMEQLAALAVADFVVDGDGEFVRLADMKRTKAALDAMFAPLFPEKGKDLTPAQRELIARITSEELLTALGAQEWTMLVASWNGSELQQGEPVEFESEEPTPLAPDVPIRMSYRATLLSRVPCDEDAAARPDCVLLEMRSTPEPASLKALLMTVMKQAIEEDPAEHIVMERYEVVNTIRLVTEPATLRPHRLETEKRIEMVIGSQGKATKHVASQVERRTSRYVY